MRECGAFGPGRFSDLTSESRFQKNRKRLNLLARETIEYQGQAENIKREIKERGRITPKPGLDDLQPRLRGIA